MNTRSFFKSLALLTASAAVSPGLFIPKFEPVRWKRKRLVAVPNPDYKNAIYEIGFYFSPELEKKYIELGMVKWEQGFCSMPTGWYPVRGNETDEHGQLISIPPFILA